MAQDRLIPVGVMGYGAIGRKVAEAIRAGQAGRTVLEAVLCKHLDRHQEDIAENKDVVFTDNPDEFFTADSRIYVEASGQDTVRDYGSRILEKGCDFLVTSIGAFTDDALYEKLQDCARDSGGRLLLASGALPGVNWMYSAALTGVKHATITQIKPVRSWIHTPAAELIDLQILTEPTCFFEGTAREAAHLFPKSSNITALLALSTAGLDNTRVRTIADPVSDQLRTLIEFESNSGNLRLECKGIASDNPSTGSEVPFTVIKALQNLTSHVCIGI